jgi:hypothetical protein
VPKGEWHSELVYAILARERRERRDGSAGGGAGDGGY